MQCHIYRCPDEVISDIHPLLSSRVAMSCIPPCANCSIDTQNCIRPLDNVCPTVHTTNVGMQSKVGSGVTELPCLPYFPISYASNGHKILRLYPENPEIRHGHVTCRAETMGSGMKVFRGGGMRGSANNTACDLFF